MNFDELQDALEEAGLSPYQAELYLATFRQGDAPITGLADATTVPQPRIYDTIRDLEERDLVAVYEQDQLRAQAKEPSALVDDLRETAENFESAADKLDEEWQRPSRSHSTVTVFSLYDNLFEAAAEAIRDADGHVHLALSLEDFSDLRDALAEAADRPWLIQVSLYADSPELLTETRVDDDLERCATEVRHRRAPAPFVALIEGHGAYLAMETPQTGEYGVLVDDLVLSSVLTWYFQRHLWADWPVLYRAPELAAENVYLSIRDCIRDLRPLLDAGRTVSATVEGQDTRTDEIVERTGVVRDVATPTTGEGDAGFAGPLLRATIVLEADDGDTITVGGSGAVVEDVRARRIALHTDGAPDAS